MRNEIRRKEIEGTNKKKGLKGCMVWLNRNKKGNMRNLSSFDWISGKECIKKLSTIINSTFILVNKELPS